MTNCDICYEKIKVPCYSSCDFLDCTGGKACMSCCFVYFEFNLPYCNRKHAKCFSCKALMEDTKKCYSVDTKMFKLLDKLNDNSYKTCSKCGVICENQINLLSHTFQHSQKSI